MPNDRVNDDELQRTGPYEQVNALCASFSQEWQPEARPAFDDYLRQVADDAQPTLLRNLLHLEIERRRAAGEQPNAEEYLRKLPQHAALIRAVFLDSSSSVQSVAPSTSASRPAAGPSPMASRLGEYQLLRELGRGGMGVVYEAVHTRHGNRVALKTLPSVDGARLHLFKREFRALADINHPNLVGLHTLESDGCHWFFTMDLIDGVDFLRHVRPGGVLDESRLRPALSQLVTAVLALHSQHIIHRDLKPSNVMVTEEGHVRVLDFGLVLEADHSWSGDRIAGTPRYMAPEQALGQALTSACDWYAVGVMLYEALTGKAPFTGAPVQILQAKQLSEPPAIPPGPGIPEDLATLALRLLHRDPDERPDPLAIVKVVSTATAGITAARAVTGSRLVGREQQLAALQDAYRAVKQQQRPLTVFVRGRSGEGKTALVEQFLEPLRGRTEEVAVMSGRCYDRESVPFKALDNLIDALASYLRSLPETDAALLLPKDIGVLAQVFPVLQRVKVVELAPRARTAGLDEQQVRQRAFAALRELLWRISDRRTILWFIDDLQWGDSDSAEALFEVLRPPEAPVVLFLGTFRSDEADTSPFLRMWEELKRKHDVQLERREVSVGPLSVEECTRLVVSLLGQDSAVIRQRAAEFATEAGGNPFLLIELVGCFDPATDSFHVLPIHEVIAKKLQRLPPDAPDLLQIIAVAGQALPVGEASRAVGQAATAVATLTHMRNERLIRLVGTEENPLVDTYHDRIRETVLRQLDDGRCKTLHRTLAAVIERDSGGISAELATALAGWERHEGQVPIARIYDLAYHYDAAGDKRKAWMYGLLAAEQARRQSALEVANNNYALASRNAEETPNSVRYRLAEGCGETLMLLGRYEEANQQLDGVIDLVPDVEMKAQIEALQSEIAFKQGQIDESIKFTHSGLRRLGIWVPNTGIGLAYGVLRESVIQACHTLFPNRLHQHQHSSHADRVVRLFAFAQGPAAFGNTFWWLFVHLSGLNRAERVPPSARLVFSTATHGMFTSMLGWLSRGAKYRERSLSLSQEFDNLLVQGDCYNLAGIGCQASARFEEGKTRFAEAICAYEKAGDFWMSNLAHFHKGCCHFGLGDLAEAIAEARWTFASAARIGDSRTMCSSWLWARATRGNLPFEELRSCLPCRPDDVISTVHALLAEGYWHTNHGRTAEALQVYERATEMVRTSLCVNSHTILVVPMLTMGLRLHADAVQAKEARQAEQLRRRACRVAKWATRLTWLFPAAYPLALRERALILAVCGKPKQALKFADRSCAVAESQHAKYEHAQSLLVRGRLAQQLGVPGAGEQLRAAEAAFEAIERPARAASICQMASEPIVPKVTFITELATPAQPDHPRRRLGWALLGGLVGLIAALLLGHLMGRCTGYVAGFAVGEATAWSATGGVVGCGALPVVLLAGWVLVRAGQRHHEAEIKRAPRERPRPPSALVRHGLLTVLVVLGLSASMVPVALGLRLGGVVGGVVGLAAALVIWHRSRRLE